MVTIKRLIRGMAWRVYGKRLADWRARRLRYLRERSPKPVFEGPRSRDRSKGRALITYVSEPFAPNFDQRLLKRHSNFWKTQEIAKLLSEFGFDVDVTDWKNPAPPPVRRYQALLGHGPAFEHACRDNDSKSCQKIYLGTTAYLPQISQAEITRIALLKERRGVQTPRQCFAEFSQDTGPRQCNSLLLLGSDWVISTYSEFLSKPFFRWRNVVVNDLALPNIASKDFEVGRRHFLWLASYAAVHRGLDLLLEVFDQNPNLHLWICGSILHEKKFVEIYKEQLFERPNIHFVGWTDVSSEQFRQLASQCCYAIFPSASDAMAGALVNQMACGLLPVCTQSAGTFCGGHEVDLPHWDSSAIDETIRRVACADPVTLRHRSASVQKFALDFYSKENFQSDFRSAFSSIFET